MFIAKACADPAVGYCSTAGIEVRTNHTLSSTTLFCRQHARRPSGPAKRSKPLHFTPPNGSDCGTKHGRKCQYHVGSMAGPSGEGA
jgi:hypothetical protein